MSNLLIPDAETKSFKAVEDLRKHFLDLNSKFLVLDKTSKIPTYGQDKDGRLTIDFGYGNLNFSETGFDRYCKLIKAPSRFVKELPYDNIVKDLTASILKSKLEKFSFIMENDKIVGASQKESPLTPLEVLELGIDPSKKEFSEISVSEGYMFLRFTKNATMMPFGEAFRTGLSVTHDCAGGLAPDLDYYFFRLVCSNGAVSEEVISLGRFSGRMDKPKILQTLKARIDTNLTDSDLILKESILKMTSSKINPDERKHLRNFLAKKMDWENHDDIQNKFDMTIKDDSNYYDLMNVITDGAKNYDSKDKLEHEILGGSMVGYFMPVKPTSEVFRGYSEFRRQAIHKERIGE